jgi:O-acetyl-ADP-ribose deacetylase (regulator of RNase III)
MLQVQVVANGNINDARVFATESGPRIEFNPQMPRERVRFSIAHELAHLFFPDWKEEVRNRSYHQTGDHWQLEMLCNLAASEFVLPIGSLPSAVEVSPIEQLMVQRRSFDVSAEAFLIRVARIAESPIAVFFATRKQDSADSPEYRIDYSVASPTAPVLDLSGASVPADSRLKICTAVGYSDRSIEQWVTGEPTQIEFVGIPPYPGRIYPRVAGIVRFEHRRPDVRPINFVHGNVADARGAGPKVICQIVNDKAVKWGGGVARKIGQKYPHAEEAFSAEMMSLKSADRLGKVIFTEAEADVVIASMIAQEGFGPSLFPRLRYSAVENAMAAVAAYAADKSATIHMPRIGTGASGGDWNVVEEIVEDKVVRKGLGVTVYDLPPSRKQFELFG